MTDSLASRLFESQARHEAPALVQGETVISHRQLRSLVLFCMAGLRSLGLAGGETIGLTMAQSPLFCVTQLALAAMGVVHLPLHPSLGYGERCKLLEKFGATAVLTDREVEAYPGRRMLVMPSVSVASHDIGPAQVRFPVGPETPLSIALTSGTTGASKGVLRTHACLINRIDCSPMPLGPGTRLIPPDLHQAISQCYSVGVLLCGGTLVFPRTYQYQDMIHAIASYGVTHLILSPAVAKGMAESLPEHAGALASVTELRLMGGHPSPRLLELIRTRMTSHVASHYGSTETGVIAVATSKILADNPDSTGRIHLPCVAIEIVDSAGRKVGPGVAGEVRIRSEYMPTTYLNDPEASAERFRDGWFHPGDIGHLDADGLLHLHGRNDHIVNIGGHKATTEYIEGVIEGDDEVGEAGVVQVDGGEGEAELAAFVVARTQGALSGLPERCVRKLGVLAPKRYFQVQSLPRTDSGKVMHNRLREMLPKQQALPETD